MKFKRDEEVRILSLEELKGYISHKIEEESTHTINNANSIIDNINSILINIINIGGEIENIKPDKSILANQYISAMNNAKNSILLVTKSIKSIKSAKNIEEVYKYERDIKSILTKIGQTAGSHRRVIYELFPIQGKKLKGELTRLSLHTQELEQILDNYKRKMEIFNSINEKIARILNDKDELNKLEEDEGLSKEYERLELNNKSIGEMLNNIKKSEYLLLSNRLSKAKSEYNKLINEFNEEISNIIRAIKKYEYTIGIEMSKKKVLYNLIDNNIKDLDQDIVISILNDIIKALREGRIELKNSDKIIRNIEELIYKLPFYISNINEYNVKISDIDNEIRPFEIKIKDLESNLEHNNMLLDNINNKIKERDNKIHSLKDSLSHNIKSINDTLDIHIPTIRAKVDL